MTETLTPEALSVVNNYLALPLPGGPVACPYHNNTRKKVRMGLRVQIGKGSPEEIAEEAQLSAFREHINLADLGVEMKKKFLIDHNLGIDCSGLAYNVLNIQSKITGKGGLAKHLLYPYQNGFVARLGRVLRSRYVENAGARTLGHPDNSHEVPLLDAKPGDFIVMIDSKGEQAKNHIVLIESVSTEQNVPTELAYVHSIAWPSDGVREHGAREGKIIIRNINHSLLDQTWIENGKMGPENYTYHKATGIESLSLRRLNWF